MNTDRIIPVNREHLLLMQVLCWLGPGIKILITGIRAMLDVNAVHPERTWWLCLIAVAVAVSFSLMFNNFVKRYTGLSRYDMRNYDLILDMDYLTEDEAVEKILAFIER